ncbi:hypothetical protein PanWU01x14_225390 [Parasponia andersonii]|uniref:Uncharacterized protein n=1 Tax=Parasponia andersonii TaxID=3476 RepID=A0A2P5BMS6_PARAD|nr:hypothetical protein PanWU01x14_225390 [Parasponia andersonii]
MPRHRDQVHGLRSRFRSRRFSAPKILAVGYYKRHNLWSPQFTCSITSIFHAKFKPQTFRVETLQKSVTTQQLESIGDFFQPISSGFSAEFEDESRI